MEESVAELLGAAHLWDVSIRQRLYPTPEQLLVLQTHCTHARLVWNLALEQWNMYRPDRASKPPNAVVRSRELTHARQEFDWLAAGSRVAQAGALKDFAKAVSGWHNGRKGRPTWRSARDVRQGFEIVVVAKQRKKTDIVLVHKINRKWAAVTVPHAGRVRFRLTRAWAQIRACSMGRVTFQAGQWHITFIAAPTNPVAPAGTGAVIGIDRGVTNSLATSDGHMAHTPSWTPGEQKRFLVLQARLHRQQNGSRRRENTKTAIGKLYLQLRNRRTDWVEQITTALARSYDGIALEKLQTSRMVRRPKPKPAPDAPDKYLRNKGSAKAKLNRGILASCWGKFAARLTDKMAPGAVVLVAAAYTSQRCHQCGYTSSDNRESQAVFHCARCGRIAHADTNAALNIRSAGFDSGPRTSGIRAHNSAPSGSRANHQVPG